MPVELDCDELDEYKTHGHENPNNKFPRPACLCTGRIDSFLEDTQDYIWDDQIERWVAPCCGDIY